MMAEETELRQQLADKEAELTEAMETIEIQRRQIQEKEQQNQEMKLQMENMKKEVQRYGYNM